MDVLNFQKDQSDGGLRLVPGAKASLSLPVIETQFVNYTFFRVNPAWRRLDRSSKAKFKNEFETVFDEYRGGFLLYSYSLVGFDSKADLMFWRIGTSLDLIQEMTASLYRTDLGSYLEPTDNFLSVTNRRMFVDYASEDRSRITAGSKRYHFIYPCGRQADSLNLTTDERDALIEEEFLVGMKFPNIKIHLTHAFGFSDQEYLITFETDEPKDFLTMADELRETSASKFTLRGMPVYTCRQRPLMDCLDALG